MERVVRLELKGEPNKRAKLRTRSFEARLVHHCVNPCLKLRAQDEVLTQSLSRSCT